MVSLRITPARAGKTMTSRTGDPRSTDHPRACGENSVTARPADAAAGSPPRVRGKRLALENGSGDIRITPARAGKTSSQIALCIAL